MAGDGAELILLGTGTCSVSERRSMAACALEAGGDLVLVDCGPGCIRRMADADLSAHEVKAIFLTHYHVDHAGDLAALLFVRAYDPAGPGWRPLLIAGPPGLAEHFDAVTRLLPEKFFEEREVPEILVLEGDGTDSLDVGGLSVTWREVKHSGAAIGYRIEAGGSACAFSGDTEPCDNLVLLAKGADAFVCECSVPDNAPVPGHMTPTLVGKAAAKAGCRKVVLTHLYPIMEEIDAEMAIWDVFDGTVVRGEDGMRIPLGGK